MFLPAPPGRKVNEYRRTPKPSDLVLTLASFPAPAGKPARDPAPHPRTRPSAPAQQQPAASVPLPFLRTFSPHLPVPVPVLPPLPPPRPFRGVSPVPILPPPRPQPPGSWRPRRKGCASGSHDVRPLRAHGPPCPHCPPFPPQRPPPPTE